MVEGGVINQYKHQVTEKNEVERSEKSVKDFALLAYFVNAHEYQFQLCYRQNGVYV